MKANCIKCNTTIDVDVMGDSGSFTCPHCGQKNFFKVDGDKVFSIDYNLYSLGPHLPYSIKYNKLDDFWDKGKRGINWFLTIKKTSRIAIAVGVILLIVLISSVYFITKPSNIEDSIAFSENRELWETFREENPYNVQLVGIRSYDDGSYNIILSEPSERVTESALNKFLNGYNCFFTAYKKRLGVDGWLRDAVISINGLSDKRFSKFKTNLFELLYGTAYKAEFVDLAYMPEHIEFSDSRLNYQVSGEELNKWFIGDGERLVNIDDNSISILKDILNSERENTLYHSELPGFVVWVLERNYTHSEEEFRVNARRFALDSDLILGAISNKKKVAIIARERDLSICELSPLRPETVLMLASTDKDELSQSYERNNLFAGKLDNGKDFAPILLSDELWHTEYGNLLNVTDQMLKSWSENGHIEYADFAYPKPFEWAFENGAVSDLGVSTLTYNWNTAGAGYIIENEDGLNVYAVNRTGSLPVSYIPGDTDEITESDPVYLAEEKAYDFFSGLQNPELVKVVQYASIYQIFNNFDVDVNYSFIPESLPTTNILNSKLEAVLRGICEFYPRENKPLLNNLAKNYSASSGRYSIDQMTKITSYFVDEKQENDKARLMRYFLREYDKLQTDVSVDRQQYAEFFTTLSMLGDDYQENALVFMRQIDSVNNLIYDNRNARLNGVGENYLTVVSDYVNNPRNIDRESIFNAVMSDQHLGDELYCQYTALLLADYTEQLREYAIIFDICDLNQAYEHYLSENKDKSLIWQKCPTVVLSWNATDSLMSIGGHNLDSKVTPVKVNKSLKPGKYKITTDAKGNKSIEVSASDKGRVTPSFLRRVERTNLKGEHEFVKSSARIRERNEVFATNVERKGRGFNEDHLLVSRKNGVYTVGNKSFSKVDDFVNEIAMKISAGEESPYVDIEFRNFSERDVYVILDGANEIRLTKSPILTDVPRKAFDLSKMQIESLPDGRSKVRVPIMADLVHKYQTEKINSGVQSVDYADVNLSIWKKVKYFYDFYLPSSKVKEFQKVLIDFIKDPLGTWDNFKFKQKLKTIEVDSEEYMNTYHMTIAQLYNSFRIYEYLEFYEKEVA